MAAALSSGRIQDDIAKVAETRAKQLATGRMEMTGVSTFPKLGDDGVKVVPWPEATSAAASGAVHINDQITRTCILPVGSVKPTDRIVTIEGLSATASHPVQKAWAELDVPQCGYCQSGQIMAAAALLKRKAKPTDQDIDDAMTNICRCGTYQRIRAAVHMAAGRKQA